MKVSQAGNSISTRQQCISKSHSRSKSMKNSRVQNKFYFCHYKNAMYMGGMKSFTKNGQGVIIHDNGASIICSHYNDFKHGHQIVFYQNCLMSLNYDKNKMVEAVVRINHYLIFQRFNRDGQLDGKGVLIDYQKKMITHLTYRKNVLVNKREQKQYSVINKVFDLQNTEFLIGVLHSKAMKFQLISDGSIGCAKSGNKISMGFNKSGLLNGLGFIVNIKDNSSVNQSRNSGQFAIKPIQRGYFHNSQITGMGQKWFKNGNYYIGQFKDSIFQGRGILKNSDKNNWAHGCFCKGNMTQLLEYSHQGDLSRFNKLIEIMHQRKSTWIDKQITVQNPQFFEKHIQRILSNKPIAHMKNIQQKKQQVLRKIQDNFICEDAHAGSPFPFDFNFGNQKNEQVSQKPQYQNKIVESSFQSPQKQNQSGIARSQQNLNGRSIYNVKILDTKSTGHYQNSTGQKQKSFSRSPINLRDSSERNKLKMSQKSMGFSQIKDQSVSLKMDSKRMVGRSRLFKYSINEQQQQPPTFNYKK